MIREVSETIGEAVAETVGRAVGRAQEQRPLPADLLESDDAFLAVFDAPAATGEDVQVQFDNGLLRVRLDRFREFREDYEMRFPGRGLTLEGRISLPDDTAVEPTQATATVRENGTVEVRIPKVAGDLDPEEVSAAEKQAGVGESTTTDLDAAGLDDGADADDGDEPEDGGATSDGTGPNEELEPDEPEEAAEDYEAAEVPADEKGADGDGSAEGESTGGDDADDDA